MERARVALLGLSEVGAEYLAVIRAHEQFDLVAVADTDPAPLRRFAEELHVRAYEDYRSLIAETSHAGLDLLFVAIEPFQSIEFVEMAAARGIAVFHKAPVARNIREAGRLMQRFRERGCPLVVSRPWLFEPAFEDLHQLTELAGHVFAATARVQIVDTPAGWRGDSVRAGGGVLLNGAYEAVDLLVYLLGLPETVYAQCGTDTTPGAACKYDTEDVAIVSLRFGRGQVACVTACREATDSSWKMTLMGTRGVISLTPEGMVITRREGAGPQSHAIQTPRRVAPAINTFGASWLSGELPFQSTVQEHLPTMAVIEAAYLSAKTGAPESPRSLLG